jgi:hypothetical protein
MADGGEIRTGIVIEGDDESKQAFTEAGNNAEKFSKKMEGVGSILKKLGAVAVAFVGLMVAKGITRWLQESTRLASIQQDALHDLGAAYRQLGDKDVKGATADIAAFASELQNASMIGDETTIKAAALGVRFGLTGETLKKTLQAAADMSAVLGGDLNTNMQLLSRSADGNVAMLSRYGVVVDKSVPQSQKFAAALDKINEQFGGAAAAKAKTYSGAITKLSNAWGDLREAVGMSTTESLTLRAVIIELTNFIAVLTGKIQESSKSIDLWDQGFQFAASAIQTMVKVGGFAVKFFLGLKTVGNAALFAITKGFEFTIKAVELFLTPLSNVLDAAAEMGMIDTNPLRAGFEAVGETVENLSTTFENSMNQNAKAMVKVDNTVNMVVESIDTLKTRVYETAAALTNELVPAVKAVEKATSDGNDKLQETLQETLDMIDRISARRLKQIEFETSLKDAVLTKEDEVTAKEKANSEELQALTKQVGLTIATSIGAAWAEVAMGSKDAGEAIKQTVISAAETAVMSYAASGAAAAAFAEAGIPILGPILAIGAASMIFALIKGFMADIPKAAYGGYVTGGTPGVDSVGVLVQRGEGILQTGQTNVLQDLASSAQQMARNGMLAPAMAGGGGSVTVHYAPQMVVPDTSAGHKRTMRDLQRGLKKVPGKLFQRKA